MEKKKKKDFIFLLCENYGGIKKIQSYFSLLLPFVYLYTIILFDSNSLFFWEINGILYYYV